MACQRPKSRRSREGSTLRFLIKSVLFIGILVAAVFAWGLSMPREHRESSSITLVAPSDSVFALISDFARSPSWWRDVNSVRRLTGRRRESWEQDMRGMGPVQIEVTSFIEGQRLVTTILNDDQQDWGGKWTYTVERSGAGTELTIVEEGWVERPIFRVVQKLRGGAHKTLDSYLRSLGAYFGETVTPRHGPPG